MTTSDWINLIAAIIVGGGTLFLGIMAWRTIRQTRSIQKAEKRERLLNEIIEWAIDVSKCGTEKEFKEVTGITDEDISGGFVVAFFSEVRFSFQATRGKSEYISNITSNFGKDLQDAVKELVEAVELHIDLLGKIEVNAPGGFVSAIKEVGKHNTALGESTRKVIKEATKIKTRDIG